MRENEFHLLKSTASCSCPFVMLTVEWLESVTARRSPRRTATSTHASARRPAMSGAANSTAATAAMSAGRDDRAGRAELVERGSSSRQPPAAPSRSARVDPLTLALSRAIASDTTAPPAKNGSAASR